MQPRPIRQDEQALIEHLLLQIGAGSAYHIPGEVEDLDDGGMGSIQLSRNGQHAGDLVKVNYIDEDGQAVLIVLTRNQFDELFDLDIWKVDFTPLRRFPKPGQVTLAE
ncbi:MAG: hypothetical protein EOO12_06305 [Chitinophagaceae bacterium]|nr:MAG: hypothetical protein EOO12_06305 [Chitinophagaceae bacterium]